MTDRRAYDVRQWAASQQRTAGTESLALATVSTATSGSTSSVSVEGCFNSTLEQSSPIRFDPNTSRICRPTDIGMGRQSMGQVEVDVPVMLRHPRYRAPSEAHDSWGHPPRQLQQPLSVSLLQDPDAFGLGGLPKPLPPASLFAAGVDRSLMTFHRHEQQQQRQRANPEPKPSHAAESTATATAAAAAAAGFISYAALLKSIQERSAGAESSLMSSTSPQSALSIPAAPATMPLISSPLHQAVFPHHPHQRHPRTQYQFQQLTVNPQLPDAADGRAQSQLRHVPLAVRFPNLPNHHHHHQQQSTSSTSFSSVESSTAAGTTASKLWAALSPLTNKTSGLFGPTSASQTPADSAFQHQFPMAAAALAYGSWFQQPLRAAAAAAAARFRSPFIGDAKQPRLATSSSPGLSSPSLATPTTSPVVWRHRSDSGPASSSPLPPPPTTVVARLTPGGVSPVGSEDERLRKKRRTHLSSDEGSGTAASVDLMSPRGHISGRSDFPTIHAVVTAAVQEDVAATSKISPVAPLLQLPSTEQRIGPTSSWPPSLLAETKPSRRCARGSASQFSTPTLGSPSCRSEAVSDADRAARGTSQRPPSSPTAVSNRHLPRMPPPPSSSSSSPQLSPFTRGSLIDLGDGISKRIEEMDTGDFLRFNSTDCNLQLETSTVVYLGDLRGGRGGEGDRDKFVLVFAVGRSGKRITVEAAADQPFFVFGVGWSSCLPTLTLERYGLQCRQLLVGDSCISLTNCLQNDIRLSEQVPSVGALVHSRPVEFPPPRYNRSAAATSAAGGPVGHELSIGRAATSSSTLASGQTDVSQLLSDDRLLAGVSGHDETVRSSAASTSLAESSSRRPRRVRNGLENVEQRQLRPVVLSTASVSGATATETLNRKRRWSASDVDCDRDQTTLQQRDLMDESTVNDSVNATVQVTRLLRTTVTHREGFDVFSMKAASADPLEDRKTGRPPSPTT